MSSTITTTPPTASLDEPAFTSSPAATGDDGSESMNRGANYFFGFLITFVVLLLIFVGCGVLSRRRLMTRRQAVLLETWGTGEGDMLVRAPTLLEKSMVKSNPGWMSLMPLSVKLLRGPQFVLQGDGPLTSIPHLDLPRQLEAGDYSRPGHSSLSIPSWIQEESKRLSLRHKEKTLPVEGIEIVVMIIMPSETHLRQGIVDDDDDSRLLPEYQMGVATLPWYTDIQTQSH
ncbi:hypothetical protein CVT24_011297 [Panaeolus cyanescens]|uniref:Transmembrane protein n=1 Tax=Panaeolus cyanescens TaxID=181874 RepID=A0A409YV06_9AGAR|nr:hypothetical protein CVT24_011297 [Panaeolus cyanescens]